MKLDFWQLSHDGPERVVALIAERVLDAGERLLVVSADADQRGAISRALWEAGEESFLANGEADAPGAERQPALLSADCAAANGASHVVFADATYRETDGFARAFLLFDEETAPAARRIWSELGKSEGVERAFYRHEGGRWTKVQ